MNSLKGQEGDYIMHGMFCSYFTKKLEAYFNVKCIPYQFVEMDGPDLIQRGEKVGITQLPQVQCPDGSWLTDTTPIIEYFECDDSLPRVRPEDPFTAFCSNFLEDSFDEWFWAPAMYFRWAFEMDCKRRSEEFNHTILANGLKLPGCLHKRVVVWRQREIHLRGNGIATPAHARAIEELYLETLDMLQPVFEKRPYLFGERPCEADFGLFGLMFPHFGNDPTPSEMMHVRAPQVFRWLGTLWSTRPGDLQTAPQLTDVPEDLKPIMHKLATEYLPYLVANQKAHQSGTATTKYKLHGLDWEVATAPYRAYCLTRLQERFQALSEEDQPKVAGFLGENAVDILGQPAYCPPEMQNVTARQPAKSSEKKPLGRLWQSDSTFVERLTDFWARRKPSKAVPESKRMGSSWLSIYFKRYRAR
jgi:glutathione S-transferase